MEDLQQKVERLERDVETLRRERFSELTVQEVERIKGYLFDRTAATLASGAAVKYVIMTVNGKRKAIPIYDKFSPLA